jgi:predicted MFS family arabinose efflux permease
MIKLPAALSNGGLRRLLAAQLPADFADWLDFVAIGALLAFVWNAEPFVFAVLAVSLGLPYLVVGPFAGVLVDRMDLKNVLILSNLGRALATASLFFAPDWVILMVLIAMRSSVDAIFTPAKQAAIQALTKPEERMGANGLSHAINQSSKIVAPAIGGSLLIWLAPQMIFLLNAVVSVLAALLFLRLSKITRLAHDHVVETGLITNVVDGLKEVSGSLVLRASLMMMAAGYFAMFFYDTLIAPLTRDLGYSQSQLGLALAAVGFGGVIGSVVLGLAKDGSRSFSWIAWGSVISGLTVIGLGACEVLNISIDFALFVALFAILGLASAMAVVPFRTIIQNHVAPDHIGRITALSEAANTMALLIGPFIGAAIASATSIGAAFIGGGVVMLFVALRAFTIRAQS